MKQCIALLLAICSLLTFCGCESPHGDLHNFYYCRISEDYQYISENSIISKESREINVHSGNIHYILSLYLAGPIEEGLRIPLPKSVRLTSLQWDGNHLILTLSDLSDAITDAEFSLACACLTLTCQDYTGCSSVTIISGNRTATMNADNILLTDTVTTIKPTEGGNP